MNSFSNQTYHLYLYTIKDASVWCSSYYLIACTSCLNSFLSVSTSKRRVKYLQNPSSKILNKYPHSMWVPVAERKGQTFSLVWTSVVHLFISFQIINSLSLILLACQSLHAFFHPFQIIVTRITFSDPLYEDSLKNHSFVSPAGRSSTNRSLIAPY